MSHDNGLFIKLYLEEDVHSDLAEKVRSKGFDGTSALEAGTCGHTDPEQLEYAAAEGRCILSFNVPDFAVLAITWAAAGRHHSGIAVTQQVSRNGLANLHARILDFLNNTTAEEMRDTFRYL